MRTQEKHNLLFCPDVPLVGGLKMAVLVSWWDLDPAWRGRDTGGGYIKQNVLGSMGVRRQGERTTFTRLAASTPPVGSWKYVEECCKHMFMI